MRFSSRPKTRVGIRRRSAVDAPVEIDTLEARLLLATTPNILSPTGTVTESTPEFTWDAVDTAESYDLWVTSLESFETAFVETGIVGTTFTPADGALPLGKIRIWARANLSGGDTSDWSPASEAIIQAPPTLTGPVGVGARNLTADSTPEITWTSVTTASRFQIWVTDLTAKAAAEAAAGDTAVPSSVYAAQYTVQNLTPILDDAGDPVLDEFGDPTYAEVRSFVIPQNPSDPDSPPRELSIGRYRIWIRSIDLSGKMTAWSAPRTIDVGPTPEDLTPASPTFGVSPALMWSRVTRATHYEVYVAKTGGPSPFFRYTIPAPGPGTAPSTQILQSEAGTPIVDNGNGVVEAGEVPRLDADGNPIPYLIPDGSYTFWVRAANMGTGLPTVYGAWSAATDFSTLTGPTVTAPVPDGGFVTSSRPTIEWTPIHGAARYEILIYQYDSRPPFLEATSTSTSYTLTEDLPAGDYTIWVQALDTRGNPSPYSVPYPISVTGGRPVMTSPAPDELVLLPTFTWIGVADAESYELWVSQNGVDFTYINVDGIVGTSYTPGAPLDDGDYRVWVRAMFADGSLGLWSSPVDFRGGIVALDPSPESETLLADISVNPELKSDQEPVVARWQPDDSTPVDAAEEGADNDAETDAGPQVIPMHNAVPVAENDALPRDILTEIAQECVDTEWWENRETSA